MTRQQFMDEVTDFDELFQFCDENGYEDALEDIYHQDALDEYVESEISEYIRRHSWRELRDALDDIPTGYNYYRCTGWLEYDGADDEFEYYKDQVLECCDRNGDWDDEEEEEEDYYGPDTFFGVDQEDEEEESAPDEEFSVQVLIQICGRRSDDYVEELRKKQEAENAAFNGFVNSYAAKNKLPEPASWN